MTAQDRVKKLREENRSLKAQRRILIGALRVAIKEIKLGKQKK